MWDVSNVRNATRLFKDCIFNMEICNWNFDNIEYMDEMFKNTKFLCTPIKFVNKITIGNIYYDELFNRTKLNMPKTFSGTYWSQNLQLSAWDQHIRTNIWDNLKKPLLVTVKEASTDTNISNKERISAKMLVGFFLYENEEYAINQNNKSITYADEYTRNNIDSDLQYGLPTIGIRVEKGWDSKFDRSKKLTNYNYNQYEHIEQLINALKEDIQTNKWPGDIDIPRILNIYFGYHDESSMPIKTTKFGVNQKIRVKQKNNSDYRDATVVAKYYNNTYDVKYSENDTEERVPVARITLRLIPTDTKRSRIKKFVREVTSHHLRRTILDKGWKYNNNYFDHTQIFYNFNGGYYPSQKTKNKTLNYSDGFPFTNASQSLYGTLVVDQHKYNWKPDTPDEVTNINGKINGKNVNSKNNLFLNGGKKDNDFIDDITIPDKNITIPKNERGIYFISFQDISNWYFQNIIIHKNSFFRDNDKYLKRGRYYKNYNKFVPGNMVIGENNAINISNRREDSYEIDIGRIRSDAATDWDITLDNEILKTKIGDYYYNIYNKEPSSAVGDLTKPTAVQTATQEATSLTGLFKKNASIQEIEEIEEVEEIKRAVNDNEIRDEINQETGEIIDDNVYTPSEFIETVSKSEIDPVQSQIFTLGYGFAFRDRKTHSTGKSFFNTSKKGSVNSLKKIAAQGGDNNVKGKTAKKGALKNAVASVALWGAWELADNQGLTPEQEYEGAPPPPGNPFDPDDPRELANLPNRSPSGMINSLICDGVGFVASLTVGFVANAAIDLFCYTWDYIQWQIDSAYFKYNSPPNLALYSSKEMYQAANHGSGKNFRYKDGDYTATTYWSFQATTLFSNKDSKDYPSKGFINSKHRADDFYDERGIAQWKDPDDEKDINNTHDLDRRVKAGLMRKKGDRYIWLNNFEKMDNKGSMYPYVFSTAWSQTTSSYFYIPTNIAKCLNSWSIQKPSRLTVVTRRSDYYNTSSTKNDFKINTKYTISNKKFSMNSIFEHTLSDVPLFSSEPNKLSTLPVIGSADKDDYDEMKRIYKYIQNVGEIGELKWDLSKFTQANYAFANVQRLFEYGFGYKVWLDIGSSSQHTITHPEIHYHKFVNNYDVRSLKLDNNDYEKQKKDLADLEKWPRLYPYSTSWENNWNNNIDIYENSNEILFENEWLTNISLKQWGITHGQLDKIGMTKDEVKYPTITLNLIDGTYSYLHVSIKAIELRKQAKKDITKKDYFKDENDNFDYEKTYGFKREDWEPYKGRVVTRPFLYGDGSQKIGKDKDGKEFYYFGSDIGIYLTDEEGTKFLYRNQKPRLKNLNEDGFLPRFDRIKMYNFIFNLFWTIIVERGKKQNRTLFDYQDVLYQEMIYYEGAYIAMGSVIGVLESDYNIYIRDNYNAGNIVGKIVKLNLEDQVIAFRLMFEASLMYSNIGDIDLWGKYWCHKASYLALFEFERKWDLISSKWSSYHINVYPNLYNFLGHPFNINDDIANNLQIINILKPENFANMESMQYMFRGCSFQHGFEDFYKILFLWNKKWVNNNKVDLSYEAFTKDNNWDTLKDTEKDKALTNYINNKPALKKSYETWIKEKGRNNENADTSYETFIIDIVYKNWVKEKDYRRDLSYMFSDTDILDYTNDSMQSLNVRNLKVNSLFGTFTDFDIKYKTEKNYENIYYYNSYRNKSLIPIHWQTSSIDFQKNSDTNNIFYIYAKYLSFYDYSNEGSIKINEYRVTDETEIDNIKYSYFNYYKDNNNNDIRITEDLLYLLVSKKRVASTITQQKSKVWDKWQQYRTNAENSNRAGVGIPYWYNPYLKKVDNVNPTWINPHRMYIDTSNLEKTLTNIDTNEINYISELFKDYKNFDIDISKWFLKTKIYLPYVNTYKDVFDNTQVKDLKTLKIIVDVLLVFNNVAIKNFGFHKLDTSLITDMTGLFEDGRETSLYDNEGKNIPLYSKNFNVDISNWNVSNVKSMKNMFKGCKNFNSGWGATTTLKEAVNADTNTLITEYVEGFKEGEKIIVGSGTSTEVVKLTKIEAVTGFYLILKSFKKVDKQKIITEVIEITGLNNEKAKELVENTPATVKQNISKKEDAEYFKTKLVELGAEVEVELRDISFDLILKSFDEKKKVKLLKKSKK